MSQFIPAKTKGFLRIANPFQLGYQAMYDWAEFRHFRYLLGILEKGGFRAAAEALYTSQPNLTVQARQFQDNASVCLFRRSKNGQIRPTETGIAFVALARLLLEVRDEVIDALVAIERGEVARIRFGATPLVDQQLFQRLCKLHQRLLPTCAVRLTHGDTTQLAKEVVDGFVDAAVITLPVQSSELHVEELRRDRLVACLRKDHVLAQKVALDVADLQDNLAIVYHPDCHPDAHARLLELLRGAGILLAECSRASHPSEIQDLVKSGHGFALIREGTFLQDGIVTRPILGMQWTIDTAVIYHKQHHPKTVPIVVRSLKKMISKSDVKGPVPIDGSLLNKSTKRPVRSAAESSAQLPLYRESV